MGSEAGARHRGVASAAAADPNVSSVRVVPADARSAQFCNRTEARVIKA